MLNANELLIRASSMGDIMTGVAKGWNVENSLTCKRKLIEIYRELKHDRKSIISNKYTQKGIKMECDAITLYSRFRKTLYKKNQIRLTNSFFSGEYDIKDKKETIDIKCSWSLQTFPHVLVDKVDKDYEYQGQVYIDLSEAEKHTVAYCLVNAPARLIINAKNALYYELDCPDESNEEYREGKIKIEQNMIFDLKQFISDNPGYDLEDKGSIKEMSIEDKIVEFSFDRNEKTIEAMKDRVKESREWMNTNLYQIKQLLSA